MSRQDDIVTSESAKRMLTRVTPIYDDSYVGLWVFEAIGREYDSLAQIVGELPYQLSPETVTWAIELWEQRYGITSTAAQTLDERRQRIIAMRSIPKPLTPESLRQRLYNITGRWAEIDEHVSAYTFGVYLNSTPDAWIVNYKDIRDYINRHKPAHLSYEFMFQTEHKFRIGITTGYWALQYPMAGTAQSGTLPDTNILGTTVNPGIRTSPSAGGYAFPYLACGVNVCADTGL